MVQAWRFRSVVADVPCIYPDRKPLEPPPVIEILLDDNDPYKLVMDVADHAQGNETDHIQKLPLEPILFHVCNTP